jgi:nucleoid DNA-binding protein
MPRVHIEWRSSSKENYINFCKKNPNIIITFNECKNIVYQYNEYFKNYILETGEKARLPFGFGEFSINKKKRKKFKNIKGEEYINLPVDWQRSKVKGKRIYNFNYHTEGYFFGWMWFKESARIKNVDLWYFKPSRTTSRLLSHYIQTDNKYQNIYMQWKK